jgi:hypothetical protein
MKRLVLLAVVGVMRHLARFHFIGADADNDWEWVRRGHTLDRQGLRAEERPVVGI